jgi:hypothetical protein
VHAVATQQTTFTQHAADNVQQIATSRLSCRLFPHAWSTPAPAGCNGTSSDNPRAAPQVRQVIAATILIGMHGAGFANLLFLSK